MGGWQRSLPRWVPMPGGASPTGCSPGGWSARWTGTASSASSPACPGAEVGAADPVEPAQPGDERVDVLVRVLEDRRWRGLALDRLCADLVAALDTWEVERAAFHRDLRRLLEEH
jgi:hypothetical protein